MESTLSDTISPPVRIITELSLNGDDLTAKIVTLRVDTSILSEKWISNFAGVLKLKSKEVMTGLVESDSNEFTLSISSPVHPQEP
jgi:hypothetical protein